MASEPCEAFASYGVVYEIGQRRGRWGGKTWRDIHILQQTGDESSSHGDALMCGNLVERARLPHSH